MGYIFDAMNRSPNDDDPRDQNDRQHANPETPAPDSGPTTPVVGNSTGAANQLLSDSGPLQFDNRSATLDLDTSRVDERVVAMTESASLMAEEYRSIRTGLLARWQQKRHLVHTVTSATPQEGKTITTLNLGTSFAELRNRRIAVVEADLRLPVFDKMLSLPSSPGLVGLLEGRAELPATIHRLSDDRLHVIPAGRRVDNKHAVQLLSSPAMTSLVQQLRNSYDHVIIDTPPVIELADAGIIGAISDEVLFIARMNRTPRQLIEQAIRTLANYNATVGGLIATDQQRAKRRYYYYYKYGYQYGNGYRSYQGRNSKKAA